MGNRDGRCLLLYRGRSFHDEERVAMRMLVLERADVSLLELVEHWVFVYI